MKVQRISICVGLTIATGASAEEAGTCTLDEYKTGNCKVESSGFTFNDAGKVPIEFGRFQEVPEDDYQDSFNRLAQAQHFLHSLGDESLAEKCHLTDEFCAFWATTGECENNPGYMERHCGAVCFICKDTESLCKRDPNRESLNALKPGDLDQMFQHILSAPEFQPYEPTAVLKPGMAPPRTDMHKDSPWIVTFEKLLSEEECAHLIQMGEKGGFEKSTVVDEDENGQPVSNESKVRTSSTAWCDDACEQDATTQSILWKLGNITGIPDTNAESLQLLYYQEGQFYDTHHDYINDDYDAEPGPRILTLFLYLNDVEAGGGTEFTDLGVTVMPKRGKAVLWPSVLNDKPKEEDPRTMHAALPVEKGVKYGANSWIHIRDFKTPYANGCLQSLPDVTKGESHADYEQVHNDGYEEYELDQHGEPYQPLAARDE